ncbi:MAG: tRNA lysidine(34) synthetase TilS [Planctomycetota bacterium]
MRLPLRVANAIRSRQLIAPGQRVLIALSGGPDSVALFHCLLELSKKRDLKFLLCAAHLNHGLRGKSADADEEFCRKLCARKAVPLLRAFVPVQKLMTTLRRSNEETARIARHAFLAAAAARASATCVAVAHHADDRIETVLYRMCRGTGLSGLRGIGWSGPLRLEGEPDVEATLEWRKSETGALPDSSLKKTGSAGILPAADGNVATIFQQTDQCDPACAHPLVVRPLLGCARAEVLAYLRSKRQRYCTDETNLDVRIPRNALRHLVLPLLEKKVHPGARAALWRLAEEAEVHAEKRAWNRDWLAAFANVSRLGRLALPVSRLGEPPSADELSDALEILRVIWDLGDSSFSYRHARALRALFNADSGPKQIDLPGNLRAERRQRHVIVRLK